MTEAFICDAIRTPVGRYAGGLSKVRSDDLGAIPLSTLMVLDGMKYGQEHFKERGFKTTMCVVDTEDHPILRLHFKLGFEEIGKVLHTRKLLFHRWSRVEHYDGTRYDAFKRPRRAGRGVDGGGH